MRRRQILGVLGAVFAASAIASVAGAQQPGSKIPRIGLLVPPGGRGVEGVRQGLRELGYIEGENIAIDIPSAEGRLDHLRELATELVDRKVAVVVTFGGWITLGLYAVGALALFLQQVIFSRSTACSLGD